MDTDSSSTEAARLLSAPGRGSQCMIVSMLAILHYALQVSLRFLTVIRWPRRPWFGAC
jgi:hypothetical protein